MLKFEGVIRDGIIVPDEPTALKEGTRIKFEEVAPEAEEDPEIDDLPTFAESFGDLRGCLSPDTPADFASQHDHYRLGTPKR